MKLFKVDNRNEMNCLQNHPEDEIVYVQDEKLYFKWNGNEYEEFHFVTSDMNISLYELNKQAISQFKSLTQEELNGKKSLINAFKNAHNNKHYMFMCREQNSYTIFEQGCKCKSQATHDFATEFIDLITEYGKIKAVDKTADENALEVWIYDTNAEDTFAYYLFPYDTGVVYYG